MITIAEKIKAILDIKAEMKDVINTLGGSANDDFSLYPAEIEKLEIESIMKLLAAATNNFTSYELLYSSTPMTEINCDGWKNKFTKPHTLNNIKSALIKPTKTSIPNFEQWAELLGFDWEIRIFDNGQDKNNPLKYDIVFRSDEGLIENRDE